MRKSSTLEDVPAPSFSHRLFPALGTSILGARELCSAFSEGYVWSFVLEEKNHGI